MRDTSTITGPSLDGTFSVKTGTMFTFTGLTEQVAHQISREIDSAYRLGKITGASEVRRDLKRAIGIIGE
jgi:hypothetical protein